MAAHKYWRLVFTRRSGVAAVVSEIQFRTAIGGSQAAVGGTPMSSAPAAGSAANAFDGNTSTSFTSTVDDPVFVGYSFAAPVSIVEVSVRTGSSSGTRPYSFVVEQSDDAVKWNSVGQFDMSTQAVSTVGVFKGFATEPTVQVRGTSARYEPLNGAGTIAGKVAIDGSPDTPVRRRVRLYDRQTGMLVREMWSDANTGAYNFSNLPQRAHFVLTHDHTDNFNAVIRDNVLPE